MNHLARHWPFYAILACSLALGLAMYAHQDPKRKTFRRPDQIEAERRQLERDFVEMHAPARSKTRPATSPER